MGNLPEHLSESGLPTLEEIDFTEEWCRLIESPAEDAELLDGWASTQLPFSFKFSGQDSRKALSTWRTAKHTGEDGEREIVFTAPSGALNVRWKMRQLKGYPAVEWVLVFENVGQTDTALIEDVQALDLELTASERDARYVVHGANGGRSLPDDFMPFTLEVTDDPIKLGAVSKGNSSDFHLPLFNIGSPDGRGVVVGVGWSAQWLASVASAGECISTKVGMVKTAFVLHPGETVRSPRILLVFWQGKSRHGNNMLRQVLHKHYLRDLRNRPHRPMVTVNSCFTHHGGGLYLTQATEQTLKPLIQPLHDLGVEAFVIDAGWYECNEWMDIFANKGDYTVSRSRYPNGFRAMADDLAAAGVDFGLWIPPEFIGLMDNEAHRNRFLDYLDHFVRDEGFTMYRQDMSLIPDDVEPDRVGIPEMQHIEGLYSLLHEMIRRYPDLIMEGCCGGGRRIDLETLGLFHWHQKSDKWFDTASDQCGLYGANMFLPGGVINVPTGEGAVDDYTIWTAFAGQLCLAWHPIDPDFPQAAAVRQIELYKSVRDLLSGDFYPLTECALDAPWIAYQFHRTDLDKGFALAFRRSGDGEAPNTLTVLLKGLEPEARYRVHMENAGMDSEASGSEIAEGLEIFVSDRPGAEMVVYERI